MRRGDGPEHEKLLAGRGDAVGRDPRDVQGAVRVVVLKQLLDLQAERGEDEKGGRGFT